MGKKYVVFLLLVGLLISCNRGKNVATSIGQPYEVVLEGDTDSIVRNILTEDVPALPQPEPMCNIIQVKPGKVHGSYRMVRTRIVVGIDPRYQDFSAKSTQDEDASPQLVIRLKAKSVEQLRAMFYDKNGKLNNNAEQLRSVINQHELQHLVSSIKQNPEKQREVKRMFGLDMKIPAYLDASKKAKGFLWLSNNASSGMQNLIIFRLKGNGCSESNGWTCNLDEINQVLKRQVLGETDDMYMRLISQDEEKEKDENLLSIERGLWDMKGDAMGGPYLLKVLPMSNGEIITPRSYPKQPGKIDSRIVVIAFVYAPEMKKRNLIKQLEAVLTTIHGPRSAIKPQTTLYKYNHIFTKQIQWTIRKSEWQSLTAIPTVSDMNSSLRHLQSQRCSNSVHLLYMVRQRWQPITVRP